MHINRPLRAGLPTTLAVALLASTAFFLEACATALGETLPGLPFGGRGLGRTRPHAGNLESCLAWREVGKRPVPGYVEDELRGYLEYGNICFGSALNHDVHLHACVTDGVFVPADNPRMAAATRIKSPARTTPPGLPGRNLWPGRERSFRSSARTVAATSG
jgi:hypothetical protein